jgi:CRISPR-associated protein Cas1
MIARTLYFGNPAYLHLKQGQIWIEPRSEDPGEAPLDLPRFYRLSKTTIPIEDIGVVLLDHPAIVLSQALLSALAAANVAVITCDDKRHPQALLLPLSGNTLQQERYEAQIQLSEPLRKQLWQQTITAKLHNQGSHLAQHGLGGEEVLALSKSVRAGDTDNLEARGAALYWRRIFVPHLDFSRDPAGAPPNNLLNYGYAILRAITARALVAAGLLPTLGIHHHNRYNAFCLADDLMEPYRPYVDALVRDWMDQGGDLQVTTDTKRHLLSLPTLDVVIGGKKHPLLVAVQMSATSLCQAMEGKTKKVAYPLWNTNA